MNKWKGRQDGMKTKQRKHQIQVTKMAQISMDEYVNIKIEYIGR